SMLLYARDEQGRGFTDEELCHQLMTLLFGGHDTTAAAITFLLNDLSNAPAALARIAAEQLRAGAADTVTAAQLARELPALDAALDESLRLHPRVWFGARHTLAPVEI